DARCEKGPETLSGRARQVEADGVFGKALGSVATHDFAAHHGANRPVNVLDRQLQMDRLLRFQSRTRMLDELIVESLLESVILRLSAAPRNTRGNRRIVEDAAEV